MEENLPDTKELILGKLGINLDTITSNSRSKIKLVQAAHKNKINPYRKKIKPNKLGNPET